MNDPATKLPLLLQRCKELVEMAISPEHHIRPLEEGEQLLADLIEGQTQLSLALELLEKADYAIGYVLDVRELKCMHPGRAVDDCCAVCLINEWRKRLDASGLLGEIGGTK